MSILQISLYDLYYLKKINVIKFDENFNDKQLSKIVSFLINRNDESIRKSISLHPIKESNVFTISALENIKKMALEIGYNSLAAIMFNVSVFLPQLITCNVVMKSNKYLRNFII